MRHALSSVVTILACGLALGGCFLFHQDRPDSGLTDGGTSLDGSVASEGGMCPWLGTTRLCGPLCDERCGEGFLGCDMTFHMCIYQDARGSERCSRSAEGEYFDEFCFADRLCFAGGPCVDREFCRWARDRPEPEYLDAPCFYSDGTELVDGPPDEECGVGADPDLPFCGGRCGDTCPPTEPPVTVPGCFGISETRAFGVCAPDPNPSCTALNTVRTLGFCSADLGSLRPDGPSPTEPRCVCMRLTREPGGPFPDQGTAVALDSCLAYRERYPDQVSCLNYDWEEEP